MIQEIKRIFPSLPSELKDSVSLKKVLAGNGNWSYLKELQSWVVNTVDSTLRLSAMRRAELFSLMDMTQTQ